MMVGSFGEVLRDFCPFPRVLTLFYGILIFELSCLIFGVSMDGFGLSL